MVAPLDWIIHQYLPQFLDAFINPQKRVSLIYLLCALVAALIWSAWQTRSSWREGLNHGLRRILSPAIWWSESARSDYKLMLINRAIIMFIAPALLSKLALATFLYFLFADLFVGSLSGLDQLPVWIVSAIYTVFLFTFDDFSRFVVHLALHRIPLLWAFHKTHHSAERLTPFTVYRTHPVEGVLFALRATVVQALSIALFVFLFGKSIDLVAVYGVNVLLFVFNATGANLRHSHFQISYGRSVENFLISPAQHQIHHSLDLQHHDRNFGAALAIWDRFAGTLCPSNSSQKLTFGLSAEESAHTHQLINLYAGPFIEVRSLMRRSVSLKIRPMLLKGKISLFRHVNVRHMVIIVASAVLVASFPNLTQAQELNVYSHRQPFLIKPFLKAFEKKTGTKVNVVFSSKGLVQRLLAEGPRSPADVILTVDIGRLDAYNDKGLLAPISSKILRENIPPHLRDPKNRWFALSKRARIVAVAKGRVKPGAINRIEDLARPEWKGRICSRPGSHVYNRALLASMIAAHGEKKAEAWARALVSNLARRPQGNDRAQVKAMFQGVCDVAIINSYYYRKLKSSTNPSHRQWGDAVRLVYTNQKDRGNHMNISGAGVAKHSKNKLLATSLLEFLTQETAQNLYGNINYEYPVNPKIPPSAEVKSWGAFVEDKLPIATIAKLAPTAQRIIDRVGW